MTIEQYGEKILNLNGELQIYKNQIKAIRGMKCIHSISVMSDWKSDDGIVSKAYIKENLITDIESLKDQMIRNCENKIKEMENQLQCLLPPNLPDL